MDLFFDLFCEVVHVVDSHAPSVDQFEVVVLVMHEIGHTVPRDPRGIVDNGQAAADQPVKNAGLADIGASDNHDLR